MDRLSSLRLRIFADGADFDGILAMRKHPMIKGFTTNPSLMHKAGVTDYEAFARRLLSAVPDRPISFEVFADEPREMLRQARIIASWGPNVNVKIPVQADEVGCHIITVTHDALAKLGLVGRDLDAYSLETVEMFHRDANAAGFTIAEPVTSSDAAE